MLPFTKFGPLSLSLSTPKYPVPLFWLKPKTQAGRDCGPALMWVLARDLNPHPPSYLKTFEQWGTRSPGWKRNSWSMLSPPEEYGYLQIVIITIIIVFIIIMIVAIITGMVMEVKMAWSHLSDHQHHTKYKYIYIYIDIYIYTRINTYTHVRYIYIYICVFFPKRYAAPIEPHVRTSAPKIGWLLQFRSEKKCVTKCRG